MQSGIDLSTHNKAYQPHSRSSSTSSSISNSLLSISPNSPIMTEAISLTKQRIGIHNRHSICESGEFEEAIDLSDELGSSSVGSSTSSSLGGLYGGGARWGWATSNNNNNQLIHQRKSSVPLLSNSLPCQSFAPLSRVVSAGNQPLNKQSLVGGVGGTGSGGKDGLDGIGLFRRMSAGFAAKPKNLSPPASIISTTPSFNLTPSAPISSSVPIDSTTQPVAREGRRLSTGNSTRPKRKISPFGERLLHSSSGF